MSIIVQKYGGSSVANEEAIRTVAQRVVRTKQQGNKVVVVVSAMGDTTDHLLSLANRVSKAPDRRELDMLVTAGERISIALLSMAIWDLGHEAISFTGSQSGIITNTSHNRAKIVEVRPFRIQDELARDRIVIVAGYQGVSYNREITALGRGGTDATAVALAAALDAESCEIYSDVDGIYTSDPNVVLDAKRLDSITYDEMLTLSKHGARVMNADAVAYAQRHKIALFARGTTAPDADKGTLIRVHRPESSQLVTGVTHRTDCWSLQFQLEDPAEETKVLRALTTAGIAPHLVNSSSTTGHCLDALVCEENHSGLDDRIRELALPSGTSLISRQPVHTVSVVGNGLIEDVELFHQLLDMAEKYHPIGVHVEPISTTFVLAASNASEQGGKHEAQELTREIHNAFIE
ncbi:MAG: aspartate kinase [Myxococcales bacterium]|nr:aspartate kinase [Myxococcales bacterium]